MTSNDRNKSSGNMLDAGKPQIGKMVQDGVNTVFDSISSSKSVDMIYLNKQINKRNLAQDHKISQVCNTNVTVLGLLSATKTYQHAAAVQYFCVPSFFFHAVFLPTILAWPVPIPLRCLRICTQLRPRGARFEGQIVHIFLQTISQVVATFKREEANQPVIESREFEAVVQFGKFMAMGNVAEFVGAHQWVQISKKRSEILRFVPSVPCAPKNQI